MKCPNCGEELKFVVAETKQREFNGDAFDNLEDAAFVDLDEYNCEGYSEAYYRCPKCKKTFGNEIEV